MDIGVEEKGHRLTAFSTWGIGQQIYVDAYFRGGQLEMMSCVYYIYLSKSSVAQA
jgi:hypothetical protein